MTKETRKTRAALVTSSLCAAALAAAATQYVNTNIVSGQISPVPAQTGSAVPAAAVPAAAAPTTYNAPAAVATAAAAPQTSALPSAYGAPQAIVPQTQAPAQVDLNTLRARAKTLQAQLQKMPTSLEEQSAQQKTYAELLAVQAQIQQQEAAEGQYSAYRMNRDREAGLAQTGAAQTGVAGQAFQPQAPGAFNTPDELNPLSAQRQQRQQELSATGLNTGSLYARTDAGPALTTGEVAMLKEQKEALTQQYRQLQQTIRALNPGDVALADNLKVEQQNILSQLADIDRRLNSAPQDSLDAQQALPVVSQPGGVGVVPAGNQLPVDASMQAFNVGTRMQKVNQAAQLLREAGLTQLADYASIEAPKLSDPNYQETRLVPGNWAEGDGLAEERNNPFKQVGAKDIENINTKIDSLKEQIETLGKTLADVEAQLKLLTRNSVAVPAAQPVDAVPTEGLVTEADMAAAAAAAAAATEEANANMPQPVDPLNGVQDLPSEEEEDDANLPPIPGLEELDAE